MHLAIWESWALTLRALAVGSVGAALFHALGLPAAFLTGPAVAVTLVGLLGLRSEIAPLFRNICFGMIGVSIGSSVTPEVVASAITWPLSLVALVLGMVLGLGLCLVALERAFGMDRMTAFLASVPGHLSYVLGLASDTQADLARVAIVQSIRVLLLTLLTPAILSLWGFGGTGFVPIGAVMAPWALAVSGFGAFGLGVLFWKMRLPAAYLLGGMGASALGHGTGLVPGILPPALTALAFVAMGSLIGTRFSGVRWADLRAGLFGGVVVTLLAALAAGLAAWATSFWMGLSLPMLFLAYAPGGVEIMAAMAVQIGVEPTFVAAHHVARLMVLTVLVPILVLWIKARA